MTLYYNGEYQQINVFFDMQVKSSKGLTFSKQNSIGFSTNSESSLFACVWKNIISM